MALTTQTVTGTLYYPDDTPMDGAYVTFKLTGPQPSTGDPATLPPAVVSTTTDSLGAFSINLWPNDLGVTVSQYLVTVSYVSKVSGEYTTDVLAKVQVSSSGGPFTLAGLMAAGLTFPGVAYLGLITEDQYNAAIAAQAGAEAAQVAAEAALDEFQDIWLTPKASDPTVDDDGDPLQTGALYFNTSSNIVRVYSGSSWEAAFDGSGYASLSTTNTFNGTQTISDSGEGGQLTLRESGSAKTGSFDMVAANNVLRMLNNMDGLGVTVYEFPVAAATPNNNTVMRYGAVLDEDDFATNSATRPPSQQSAKAYVDGRSWSLQTPVTAAAQSAIDFSSIPSGVNTISVMFYGLSLSGTDAFLVQVGTGGTPQTTGYISGSFSNGFDDTSTSGMIIRGGAAAVNITGTMTFERVNGNAWAASHGVGHSSGSRAGGGGVTLSGELDIVRITRTGTNTFDAGSVAIKYHI